MASGPLVSPLGRTSFSPCSPVYVLFLPCSLCTFLPSFHASSLPFSLTIFNQPSKMAYFAYWRASKRATIDHCNHNSLIIQDQVNPSHHMLENGRKCLISHIDGRQNVQKHVFPKVVWPRNFSKRQKCLKKSKFKISKNLKQFNIVKMVKNHDFSNVVAKYGATRFFTENPAVSRSSVYQWLTLCQKSKKSLERLPRILHYGHTHTTFSGCNSPKGENW